MGRSPIYQGRIVDLGLEDVVLPNGAHVQLEVIRHPRRGPFLIEVNPRFPAWVYLSAGAGANLPWAAVRLARGERVTPLRTRPGAFYARMAWDAVAPVERMGALAVEGMVSGHGA